MKYTIIKSSNDKVIIECNNDRLTYVKLMPHTFLPKNKEDSKPYIRVWSKERGNWLSKEEIEEMNIPDPRTIFEGD